MAGSILPFAFATGLILLFSQKSKKAQTGLPTTPPGFPPPGGGPPPPPGRRPGGQPFPPGTTGEPCTFDADLPAPQRAITQEMLSNPYLPASTLVAAAMIAEVNGYEQTGACLRGEAARRGGDQNPPPGFDPNNPLTWGGVAGLPMPTIPGMGPPPGGPPQPPPGGPPPPPPGGPPPPPPGGPPPPPGGVPGGFPFPIPPGIDPFNPATWQLPPGLQLPGWPPTGTTPPPLEPPIGGTMPFVVRYGDRPYGLAKYYTGNGARFRELEPLNPQLGPMVTTGGVSNYQNWQAGLVITLPAEWLPAAKPMPPTGL